VDLLGDRERGFGDAGRSSLGGNHGA